MCNTNINLNTTLYKLIDNLCTICHNQIALLNNINLLINILKLILNKFFRRNLFFPTQKQM